MHSDSDPFDSDPEIADLRATDEPPSEDDHKPDFDFESLRVLEVVNEGDEDELRLLLGQGVDLRAIDRDGQTALHLAVTRNNEFLAELLLKAGSNTDAANYDGCKPLYIAAESGNLAAASLLLRFNADIESCNDETGYTAFHRALLNGHTDVAKFLLDHEANIDALTPDGHTLLFNAVIHNNLDMAEFLLENGANKYLRDDSGKTVDDLAEGAPMVELLRSDRVLQGPSISKRKTGMEVQYTVPVLPTDEVNKLNACQGFEGTIIDFFVEETEQRIEKTVSVYDMLYGKGAEAIMNSAKAKKLDKQRSFRWYHLPANNMEWVEILVNRHFGERDSGVVLLSEESKSKLALTNGVGQQYRASASLSSYMRPLCRTIKSQELCLGNDRAEQLMLFVPFLHFETHGGYQRMADFLKNQKDEKERAFRDSQHQPSKGTSARTRRKIRPNVLRRPVVRKVDSMSVEAVISHSSTDDIEERSHSVHGGGGPLSALRSLRDKMQQMSGQIARTLRISSGHQDDLEKGTNTKSIQDHMQAAANDATETVPTAVEKKELPQDINADSSCEPSGTKQKTGTKRTDKIHEDMISSPPLPEINIISSEPQSFLNADLTSHPNVESLRRNTGNSLDAENLLSPNLSTRRTNTDFSLVESITRTNTDYSLAESTTSLFEEFPDISTQNDPSGKAQATLDTLAERASGTKPDSTRPRTDGQKNEEGVPPKVSPGNRSRRGSFADAPGDGGKPAGATTKKSKSERAKPRIPFDGHLVKGYLSPLNPADSPLHLRRTLDQYFYTHLTNTAARDSGQVVYRYTLKNSAEPKIFMVDQLWLWILNDDTIISCFPQRWDVWSSLHPLATGAEYETAPLRDLTDSEAPPALHTETRTSHSQYHGHGFGNINHGKTKEKSKGESGFMLGWVTGKKPKPGLVRRDTHSRTQRWRDSLVDEERHHSRYAEAVGSSGNSSYIERRRLALLKRDPLNVHQMILSHIGLKTRDPLTSAHDLAHLITSFCIDLFDKYRVPDEYQFFDFFERSIGAVIDQETQCFESFASRLTRSGSDARASSEVFSISAETKLLVEIKDIIDELGILHMILSDQIMPADEFSKVLAETKKTKNGGINDENSSPVRFPVLENHLYRVEKMQRLANKTYKALYNLLDLKQKQNNVSEALSARKQAENASKQAKATKELTERGLKNAKLARRQADESIRQGRTVLVFTVVTIIFLPLSFMAAFFAINIDVFPWNKREKLPMNYVLRYMLSISGAISIPFILIALNQDRIAKFLKNHGKPTAIGVSIVLLLVILLSVIWTRDIASGMKAAVTALIVVVTTAVLAVRAIFQSVRILTFRTSRSTESSYLDY
ncbi:hypothetical protein AJ78_03736 [Emergomyces pasteurianus Ep9510]|uniref:Uncharacterized protein n=1 Tax=Emergomyces pasteurianus Ep9510 TaxID=1447872 RepID=A0A1J9QIR0_9EURO|nr:hypothetical protein AJ78_03736 [Emergomyces pasteurianus Ep9510]